MRCETAVAILASEGLALVSVSRQQARELVRAFLFSNVDFFVSFFLNVKVFIHWVGEKKGNKMGMN